MPIPLVIAVGVVGAYLLGRLQKNNREKDLEVQLDISEAMRDREKKKTRKELLKELKDG